ncbi:polysaccharide biosynthesis protein [Paenibacillus sp. F411]|uniref:putative polysaccharide biosynthesis protein n=1 Tax=Paenibacillus sp. F411 TaxID=2820239 RepID=UPI001AAF85FB|nr:polysaccharide biosynthesis protein [Paenibacillus sp. F411]MBO2945949.1 polysaccharide biosynthesis protein [Paenibacillus sp. F411]
MKTGEAGARLLKGAFILSAAAIGSKLIGTLQKIPLQNIGGDAVFGIYNTVNPLYTMMITLAAAGFPLALSKFVAEAEAAGRPQDSLRLLRISSLFLISLGLVLGLLLYTTAPLLGSWIGSEQVVPALQASALALLFVPWMALLRGYFQGLHNVVPTAVSQIAEQSIRVIVMITLLLYMLQQGASAPQITAGAMLGSAAGGVAGLLVMLLYWRKSRGKKRAAAKDSGTPGFTEPAWSRQAGFQQSQRSAGEVHLGETSALRILKVLAAYALPVCLSALAIPLIGLVDSFTVPRSLLSSGLSEDGMLARFGIYNRGLPLVQLVTMLAASLSVLFIPALAEARYRGQHELAARQSELALRWFWLLGLAASAGLAVLAEPVNVMLYEDAEGSDVLRWVALTAVFGTVSIITAALLQGAGLVRAPALHLLAAALLKLGLNLALVPQLGITGAAIAGVAAHGTAAALNTALLVRHAGVRLSAAHLLLRPALVTAGLVLAAWAASTAAGGLAAAAGLGTGRMSAAAASLAGVAAGAGAFVAGAVWTKLLSEEELHLLPKIGRPLAALLTRLRLLC